MEVAAGNEPWRSWKPLIWLKTSLRVHDKPFFLKVLNLSRFFLKGREVLQVLLHHLSHGAVTVSKFLVLMVNSSLYFCR